MAGFIVLPLIMIVENPNFFHRELLEGITQNDLNTSPPTIRCGQTWAFNRKSPPNREATTCGSTCKQKTCGWLGENQHFPSKLQGLRGWTWAGLLDLHFAYLWFGWKQINLSHAPLPAKWRCSFWFPAKNPRQESTLKEKHPQMPRPLGRSSTPMRISRGQRTWQASDTLTHHIPCSLILKPT